MGIKILLVEYEALIAMAEEILCGFGYEILFVYSGDEAVKTVTEVHKPCTYG